MHARRLLGALDLTGLVAALSLAACATPTTTTPSPVATGRHAHARGRRRGRAGCGGHAEPHGCCVQAQCSGDGVALTVNKVSREEGAEFVTPGPEEVLLVTDVTIENTGRDTESYNPFYFKVRAADGAEYTTSFRAPSPVLKSGELAPGDKVRGNVSFTVPENAQGLTLLYEPFSSTVSPIRIDLSCTATPTPSS